VGHERVGLLPKTERWRDLVKRIAGVAGASDVAELAGRTTELLRGELRNVQTDRGVRNPNPALRKLYPNFTDDELMVAEQRLREYFAFTQQRIVNDPRSLPSVQKFDGSQ
jgi:hypothetical protein